MRKVDGPYYYDVDEEGGIFYVFRVSNNGNNWFAVASYCSEELALIYANARNKSEGCKINVES